MDGVRVSWLGKSKNAHGRGKECGVCIARTTLFESEMASILWNANRTAPGNSCQISFVKPRKRQEQKEKESKKRNAEGNKPKKQMQMRKPKDLPEGDEVEG